MPHVILVNPSERKGKKAMAKKRTPAQQRATRKMIAANKARSRAAKAPARKVSRAKPARRKARAAAAPAKRRRSHAITPARVASDAGRKLRYRRRNPIGGVGAFMSDTLLPSAIGGGGALALDVLLGVLPLPPAMKTGPMAPVVKVAGAVGLGMLAGMVTSRKTANQIAAGAITVTLYGLAKSMLVKVGGGKIPGLAAYPDGYMGEYVGEYVGETSEVPELGYTGSGINVGPADDGYGMGEVIDMDSMGGYETGVYR